MNFTHNLKILLFDANNNIVEDENELTRVKNILNQNNIHTYTWNNKTDYCSIKWIFKELNDIDKHFIGDLFYFSIFKYDNIILQHTNKTISSIISPYNIKFSLIKLIV